MPLLALSHMAFFWRMSNRFIKESTKKWTLFKFSCYFIQCRHRIESLKGHFLNIIILFKLSWSTDQNNTNKQISQSRTTSLRRASRWCGGPWFPLPSFLPLSGYSLPHLSRFSKELTDWSWSCPTYVDKSYKRIWWSLSPLKIVLSQQAAIQRNTGTCHFCGRSFMKNKQLMNHVCPMRPSGKWSLPRLSIIIFSYTPWTL